MKQKNYKDILKIVQEIYLERDGVDAPDLAKALGISVEEATDLILKLADDNLAIVLEIDMCCGADYLIKGLTEQGQEMLKEA